MTTSLAGQHTIPPATLSGYAWDIKSTGRDFRVPVSFRYRILYPNSKRTPFATSSEITSRHGCRTALGALSCTEYVHDKSLPHLPGDIGVPGNQFPGKVHITSWAVRGLQNLAPQYCAPDPGYQKLVNTLLSLAPTWRPQNTRNR